MDRGAWWATAHGITEIWNSFTIKELKCFKRSHDETGRTDAEAPILWPRMQRANSLEKTLMLGKIEGKRRG